jgi:predicted unusual protein kinase regulating ubiquinone biosynthesis (AarF/ABC1/UbiB family)
MSRPQRRQEHEAQHLGQDPRGALQQVYYVLARYLWDSLFPRWGILNSFRLRMQRWIWRIPDDLEAVSMPVKLRLMLEELGPTYVKIGQIVSSQASALPADRAAELARLQDAVAPFPGEQVRETIIEELARRRAVVRRLRSGPSPPHRPAGVPGRPRAGRTSP